VKIRFLAALVLPLFIAGCGNDINICYHGQGICKLRTHREPTQPKPETPKVAVVELEGSAKTCRCAQAQQFVLRNTGSPGNVSWTTYSREPADTEPRSVTTTRMIGKDDIPLSCTIDLTESTQQCQRSTVTMYEGKPYGGDVNTILHGIVATAAKADLQSMGELPKPDGSCPQKCRGTTDCLQMKAGKSVDVGRKIALALARPQPVIANSFIVNLTAAQNNVCQRSDIVFEGSKAYNVGLTMGSADSEGCEISSSLPSTLGDLTIAVPRTISFQHTPMVGDNFELRFERRQASPELKFSNGTLQSVYGGRVLAATYDAGNFVIEMESQNRCMAVRVN